MAIDPAGFAKFKYVLSDSQGSVYPGIELLLTGAPTLADLDTLAADIYSNFISNMASQFNPAWAFTGARLLYSDGSTVMEGTATGSGVGTYTGTAPVRSACLVTHYSIEDYYRGGKPRSYWPAFSTSAMSSTTHWNGSSVGTFVGLLQTHLDHIAGLTYPDIPTVTPGCIRRVSAHAPLVPPQFLAYVGTRGETRICTQRRRLGRL